MIKGIIITGEASVSPMRQYIQVQLFVSPFYPKQLQGDRMEHQSSILLLAIHKVALNRIITLKLQG